MPAKDDLPYFVTDDVLDKTVLSVCVQSEVQPGPAWSHAGVSEAGNLLWTRPSSKLICMVQLLDRVGIPVINKISIPNILYRSWALDDLGIHTFTLTSPTGEGPVHTRLQLGDLIPFVGLVANITSMTDREFDDNLTRIRRQRVSEHIQRTQ